MPHTLVLRLTFLLTCITLAFAIYTNLITTKKLALIDETLSYLQSEQVRYSVAQNKLLQEQGKVVQTVQDELSKTKKDTLVATSKLTTIEADFTKEKTKSANTVITASDIGTLLNGVSQIVCKNTANVSSGSATLWNFPDMPHTLLTNKHVVQGAENCVVVISNKDSEPLGVYSLKDTAATYNKNTDTAIVSIGNVVSPVAPSLSTYNYSIASLRKCPSTISLGSPVVIIGFPAYAKRDTEVVLPTIGSVKTIFRTVTNGIVSGYDTSDTIPKGNLKEPNFFISAKIDSGNSGGIAIAKDGDGLCVLGIPTWLTVGNYETQGLVQNIRNVLPK
jgi:S1-C subfamily serine protease